MLDKGHFVRGCGVASEVRMGWAAMGLERFGLGGEAVLV